MAAAPPPNSNWPKKVIRIGFPQNQGQVGAEILCAITYGEEWQAVSMGVVDRIHEKRETYPEIVLSGIGNIRATLAVAPSDGISALVLHAFNSVGKNYCITNSGPISNSTEIKRICQQFDNEDAFLTRMSKVEPESRMKKPVKGGRRPLKGNNHRTDS